MATQKGKTTAKKPLGNQRRTRISFALALSLANRRAHDQANRRSGKREQKSVLAAMASSPMASDELADVARVESVEWMRRLTRWLLGLAMLPLCWVTSWTFLAHISEATVEQGFWQTAEFWYFATGVLVMLGWFWSGLLSSFFLYLYVLGHELTHAVFVIIFRGKVMDFHVSAEGGYITTNKTNMVIALSPYFVPFWSVVSAILYAVLNVAADLKPGWDLAFYAAMGGTWTFHMAWTLWMLPRDQPDLKENGTFLSLVVIYLANLLVLVVLLCAAKPSPLVTTREFAMEWLRYAVTSADALWRGGMSLLTELRQAGMF